MESLWFSVSDRLRLLRQLRIGFRASRVVKALPAMVFGRCPARSAARSHGSSCSPCPPKVTPSLPERLLTTTQRTQ